VNGVLTELLDYVDEDVTCEAFVAYEATSPSPKPCVLLAHDWSGRLAHIDELTEGLARLGYVGFALDVYGKGVRGDVAGDNSHLMNPFVADRAKLARRLKAGSAAARAHKAVDSARVAIVGYCFGGLCALDLARCGDKGLRGAVSIHGVLGPPGLGPQGPISASVLVLHGWEDPLAPPDAVLALARELTEAGADWQLHAYGHAMHAFTAPGLNMPERGLAYNALADRRSGVAMRQFLEEVFA
jgi:dienelactone hydrolase